MKTFPPKSFTNCIKSDGNGYCILQKKSARKIWNCNMAEAILTPNIKINIYEEYNLL